MEPTAAIATEPTAPPTDASRFPHLRRLVGDAGTFLDLSFGRDAFRRRLAAGEASRLFSWDILNEALAAHRLGPPRLKLEKGGRQVGRQVFRERRPRPGQVLHDLDVAGLYAELRDGATLVLDAVDEMHEPLRRLCAGLAAEFWAHSQTNLYACWGESQGFDVHWDDHDVFVVQVDGAKRWDLYGFTRPAPLRREREPAPAPTHAPQQIVLEAGDMLYLPRGYWHAAAGLGEPSLHLTIGLSRKTGVDLLHWLADETAADAGVRADVRLEQDNARLGAQIAQVLGAAIRQADPAELGRRYRRSVEASARHRPELSLPHIGRSEEPVGDRRRLRLAAGPTVFEAGDDPGSVRLTHRGVRFTLAAETAPAVAALAAGESMTFGELAHRCGAAPEALVQSFVQHMLRRGVFVLEPDG